MVFDKKAYMKEYNSRPDVIIKRKAYMKNYHLDHTKERERLRVLNDKKYWEQQAKLFKLGIRQYERTPDFSIESLCRKCGTIWPKCARCPHCHIPVKNGHKFRQKKDVKRY